MRSIRSQKILVFTAKTIGLNCVNFLLENFPEDEYIVVVCEPDADLVIRELAKRKFKAHKLDDYILNQIKNFDEKHFDWLLNLWGGYIFKNDVLSRVKQSLNIHPSYLPYCRGRDPVVWAVRNAYPAGVTLHAITTGVDEGDIWHQEKVSYALPITGGELYESVTTRAWQAFCENWARIRANQVIPVAQSGEGIGNTYRRKDLLQDRSIDVDNDQVAQLLIRRLLAHDFGPDYQAELIIDGKKYKAHLMLERKEE